MIKLSDTQKILLSTASARDSGSLLPLPDSLNASAATISRSIAALTKRAVIEERETNEPTRQHRIDGDIGFGLFINDAGRAAIGIIVQVAATPAEPAGDVTPPRDAATKPPSKTATIVAMLKRDRGATLFELVERTGWLPHTTRAALSGLRKKGHAIAKGKREGATCYSISEAA